MARPLVKTHIRGFDEDVLRGGIPQGHVVLVRGASGTMKSSLAYYVLYHNALEGAPGLYVTLEQTAAGLLEHVAEARRRLLEGDVQAGRGPPRTCRGTRPQSHRRLR